MSSYRGAGGLTPDEQAYEDERRHRRAEAMQDREKEKLEQLPGWQGQLAFERGLVKFWKRKYEEAASALSCMIESVRASHIEDDCQLCRDTKSAEKIIEPKEVGGG